MSLLEKQWLFVQLVGRLIWELRDRGYQISFGDAYRSPQEAERQAKAGRGIKNSLHTDRLAIDLNLFIGGQFLNQVADYETAGRLWESYSTPEYECCWGGRFRDAYHFSIAHGGRK